jgi:hypothetical protein
MMIYVHDSDTRDGATVGENHNHSKAEVEAAQADGKALHICQALHAELGRVRSELQTRVQGLGT